MADNIVLSAAVRNNLLSLQKTASLLGKTQERLASGLKVNSALDDPTAFFTASSLNSRAGDLNRLLDSLSNGIQTLQAADDGLTAITNTVESLQATVNQARQDANFKSGSYTLETNTIGTATAKNLTFTGGSVGSTAVNIALNQAGSGDGTQTTVAYAGYAAPAAAAQATYVSDGADDPADGYVGDQAFSITFGGQTANIIVEDANNTLADIINSINADLTGSDLDGVVEAYDDAGNVGLRTIANVDGNITVAGAGEAVVFGTQTATTGSDGVHSFAVNGTAVSLNATTGADVATAIISINAQLGSAHAFEAYDAGGGALGIRAKSNGVTALAITGSSAGSFGAVTPGTADTTPGSVKTVDELVSTINNSASLKDKVRASNDNGKLRLENLSTEALTVTGISTDSAVDGTTNNTTIAGNDVRKDLINQFNALRTELDKLADDASFNGINLLRGDKLKLNFNETGSSNIEIQAKDSSGNVRAINTTNLGIGSADSAEFSDNTALDTRREALGTALTTLRTQASQFGSNLSIVQNRQDFTKNIINTLQTGAANLTLADTNEEGANLLALQTRQQLSSVALSLASQADQNVLRLF